MLDPIFVVEAGGMLQYAFSCDGLAKWFTEVDPGVRRNVKVFIVDESGSYADVKVNG